jgi:hypothetical protein
VVKKKPLPTTGKDNNKRLIMKKNIYALLLTPLLLITSCASNVYQDVNKQANHAEKSTPIEIPITTPFNADAAKTALSIGPNTIKGVLYSRLSISGRDDLSWPQSPLIKNRPYAKNTIFLYPATAHLEAFANQFKAQDKTVKKYWLNNGNKPQVKFFSPSPEALKYRIVSKTDEYGRYTFSQLKPGKYYIYSEGAISGSYNKEVYAGSSTYSDGTGVYGEHGNVDHTKLVPVNYKTELYYLELITVGNNKSPAPIESRMSVDYNKMSAAHPND